MKNHKHLVGIMGGIGAGKSTAAACFSQLGCGVIHADPIAHEVLKQSEVIREIGDHFGRDVLTPTGQIDRAKLADAVFGCRRNLEVLNGIIHPPVLDRCKKMIRHFQQDPAVEDIVLDIPLLAETGWEDRCDVLIFVDCSEEKRAERMRKKGVLDIEQQKKRENFQISLDKKKKMSHYVIDNNSDVSVLAKQVEAVYSAIRDRR